MLDPLPAFFPPFPLTTLCSLPSIRSAENFKKVTLIPRLFHRVSDRPSARDIRFSWFPKKVHKNPSLTTQLFSILCSLPSDS
jgi:hypothetical protein